MVVIQGSPDNVKSVKSFKWIVSESIAPTPNAREMQTQPKENKETTTAPTATTPSFLDNLPDNFE